MMIPAYNRRSEYAAFHLRRESIGESPISFPGENAQSCLNRDSNPKPLGYKPVAAVAEWYRYRIVACLVTSSSPVPLKTRRVGQRFMLNLSRAETSSRWCGVVVRRSGASSGVIHVT
ncbi:uncharacterized protein TNCV_2529971 [Trichonephila clavipes]|nr:uncharacterized protein TNCV_2529971 [Trichonephila clavipes]